MHMRQVPIVLRARRGFTLLEMTIAMALLLVLMGMSMSLFRREVSSLSSNSGRLDAQQSGVFALGKLNEELRVAGIGLGSTQPLLVQADPMAITFNTDLVAHDSGDLAAVYLDHDMDSLSTIVFNNSGRMQLHRSTFWYPDSTYLLAPGVPSNAETISYWLSLDSTKSSTNEYILFRQVNNRVIRPVATGIIVNPGDTVFQYFKTDTGNTLLPIPNGSLPMYHSVDVHGSLADTGREAVIDSITQVHITFKTVYHDPKGDAFRKLESVIDLLNSGTAQHSSCGSGPLGVTASVTVTDSSGTVPATYTSVTWAHSVDDGGGQQSVKSYAIYKRHSSSTTFDGPIASVPAGLASYTFQDASVQHGDSLIYGVASVDCTPTLSPIGLTGTAIIP
jgi:prepilin-type N-terminal cleavage/methylation domain-containing protein